MTTTLGFVGTSVDPAPELTQDVRVKLRAVLAVPLWADDPTVLCAGRVMGWSKSATYKAAADGWLPVVKVSATRFVVSTSVLLALVDGEQ